MVETPPSRSPSAIRTLHTNADLLQVLKDETLYKRELADRLDVSKKTIYRRMSDLQELGLADRSQNGYYLTNIGQLHADLYDDYTCFSDSIFSVMTHFSDVRVGDLPSYQLLLDADVCRAESYAPYRPIDELQTLAVEADEIKGVSSIALPDLLNTVQDQHPHGNPTGELIFEESVLARLRTDQSAHANLPSDSVRLFSYPERVPFGIFLIDEPPSEVAVLLSTARNQAIGLVRNNTVEAITWGVNKYGTYRKEAVRVKN